MENGNESESNVVKMGATGNPNAARLATLQERKKTIEESLTRCTQELRALCNQEAKITGVVPPEMPLEPEESPPLTRRRVGTSYELPDDLIRNSINKDECMGELELQMQLHANVAEAALGLANEQNISKTLRRQRMLTYQKHKFEYKTLQEKLILTKSKKIAQQQQQQAASELLHKQKKKPRPLGEQEDCVSIHVNPEAFGKSELRHSLRSNKYGSEQNDIELRCGTYQRSSSYKSSTRGSYQTGTNPRHEDNLNSGLYGLSVSGYNNYIVQRESTHIMVPYPQQYSPHQVLAYHQQQHYKSAQPVFDYSNQYKTLQHYSSTKNHRGSPTNTMSLQRQPSPSSNSPKKTAYYSPPPTSSSTYRYSVDYRPQNPHQIQPHQQYEQNGMSVGVGLGGVWKATEGGKMVWCEYNSSGDSKSARDRRFGSLDRRKNRRVHKRASPIDNKSATLSNVSSYTDHVRTTSMKSPQIINCMSQDSRQLVRTQSLGSVGVQTIDGVWPSDDNSSCEGDNRSVNDANSLRRPKQKEWVETSLDGPVSPTHSILSRSQSTVPSIISPEEQYVAVTPPSPESPPPPPPPPPLQQLILPKAPLEIPAESNPSPRLPDANIEIFNNNIPRNCTVVQAGHCKPYHEETKPFEMADFYKYSTKFKKSPAKQGERDQSGSPRSPSAGSFHKNLNEAFDGAQTVYYAAKNHNLNAEVCSPALDEWYKNQNETSSGDANANEGKSTATLV